MACMEHRCCSCNHTEFNNLRGFTGTAGNCPKCGSDDIISTFDEDVSSESDDAIDSDDDGGDDESA